MNKKFQAHSAIFFANTIFGLGVPVTKLLLDEWVLTGSLHLVLAYCRLYAQRAC